VAKAVNFARDLANTPGNDMTPAHLADETKSIFKNNKNVKVKIIEEVEAKRLGMNLFLAVGNGSQHASKLIVCEYFNTNKNERPTVLIGKGITFDTGGLNLKLGSSMNEMIMDMTGGAVCIATLKAVSDLKLKKNLIVIVPAVENAIGGESYRPGDIIKSMEGLTVEIDDTDAEGRLVLADSITYSKKYNPKYLFDVATLTGAALSALGEYATVTMTKDKALSEKIFELSQKSGDLT
jgi:leucyl aminopeptidase